jgi:hypothetical protein
MPTMFSVAERARIRAELLEAARADERLSGGAITGSSALGREDTWSDIDLAFGVADPSRIREVLDAWTARVYERHGALHHVDVIAGAWVYRVFLLASTLQVDLAFAPASEFGARAPSFRLAFGRAAEIPHAPPLRAETLIGMSWLYGLHVRSSLERGRLGQAEYMVSAMRDQVLALACLRHGLPAREGRGIDDLPGEVSRELARGLVRDLEASEIARALRVTTAALLAETRHVEPALADRLEAAVREIGAVGRGEAPGSTPTPRAG